jgi:hypothetical protein
MNNIGFLSLSLTVCKANAKTTNVRLTTMDGREGDDRKIDLSPIFLRNKETVLISRFEREKCLSE